MRIADKNITEDKLIAKMSDDKQKIEIEPKKLLGKNITFSNSESDSIFDKFILNGSLGLEDKDLTQGVVPNPDVVNSRNINKIPQKEIEQFNIKVNDGVFVVPRNSFKSIGSEATYLKPLFDTEQIQRYFFDTKNAKELISIPKNERLSTTSVLIEHLKKYRSIMEERRENLTGSISFYNLHWPRNSKYFEKGPKIISVRKCKTPTFSYTEKECYVMLTFNVIKTDRFNLKYLLALLNSKAVHFWLKKNGKLQGDQLQIDTEPLQQIPIPEVTEEVESIFVVLVDKMLSLNKKLHEVQENSDQWKRIKDDIEKTDHAIDAEVYKLYRLTEEEIKIVENT